MNRKLRMIRIKGVHVDDVRPLLDAARWRRVLHSRWWLFLPAAVVATFVAEFLLLFFGDEPRPLFKAALFGGVAALGWAVGIWVSTGEAASDASDDSDDSDDSDEKEATDRTSEEPARLRLLRLAAVLGVVVVLASINQIRQMASGDITLYYGFAGILLKIITVAAVLLPGWLERRRG